MNKNNAPSLDQPGKPISLTDATDPASMLFLHRGQTQAQVVHALYTVMYAPIHRSHRIWLLASEFEVITTFLVCTIMLIKKKSLGKLWIVAKRASLYGSFYVANAVFVLVLGVATYLVAWDLTAIIVAALSFAKISSMEWWWIIPLPWWPLVIGSYFSIHGFILGCSPHSPLSAFNSQTAHARRKSWYYLPLPTSSTVFNTTLFLPCILFTFSTLTLTAISGRNHYQAKALSHILPTDILVQIRRSAHESTITFVDGNLPASDELILAARQVAAAYFETHRFVCINLVVFAACAFTIWIPCLLYGLPNVVNLVEHTCSRYPERPPPSCTTFFCKLHFLLTSGRPKSGQSATISNINTWKMTTLSVLYIFILVTCIPAFGFIPIYIVAATYPHQVQRGDIRPAMGNAILAVSLITIFSCTFVAIFCTVATLDPLFRAAIGLNIMRTQIPIDITVEQHRTRYEEFDPVSPTSSFKVQDGLGLPLQQQQGHERSISFKPSTSTLKSASNAPQRSGECSDLPAEHDPHVLTDDLAAPRHNDPPSLKRTSI